MSATGHKVKHPLGKLLVTTALLVTSASFAYWQKKPEAPREIAAPALASAQTDVAESSGGIGAYEFHDEGPAIAAIPMPAGRHVEDGDYVSQEWESGFGTVKIKVSIRHGAFTALNYLLVPDERQRSEELSHMAKPLLIHEMIHGQKAKVDIITTATYTSWAFQDALADVVEQATRPRLTERQLEEARDNAHNLQPLYMGSQ